MKKILLRFIGALLPAMLCLGAMAQTSTFKYTATEKLPRFEEIQYFVGATGLVSHDWNESTGEGIVVYEGTVTELGSYALQWQTPMTALEIPEGVTTLGFQSVQCCANLSSVSLPKSLKQIKHGAFYYNAFDKGKFIIDDLAWWCSIQFDDSSSNPLSSAKHIYKDKDTEITDLVIPEGVTSIGWYAFYGVEGIKSVTFPSTLTSIGGSAFARTGLESVAIPSTVTKLEEYTFSTCANLKSVTIPEGVTYIGFCAFNYCGIESLTLPSTIRTMSQSFHSCGNLASLTLTEGITTVNQSFYSCNALKEVHIPGSVKLTSSDFSRCENLETVTIGEGVEEITGFTDCGNLKSITIPSTASKVEAYGLRGCKSLTSVTCLALEPPYATDQIPSGKGVSMEGRTLYVPALTLDYYKKAKNWQDFPSIQPLDKMPQNIGVRDELHLTLPATLPEGKPNVTLLHDNDPKYGILHVDGEGSLKMNRFSILIDYYMQSRNSTRALNHCSLMNNTTMEADTTVVDLWVYSRYWVFAALPFDFKVSEVGPAADGETDWVIYTYDSRKRADSEMTETWVKMTGDEVIKAGQGFIVQAQRTLNGRSRYDVGLRFKSIDNENKNRMFQTSDINVPLTVYDSEFLHNRSWNFIGNPYPCYFDMNYTDFRAPVTVWDINSRKYVAVRPGDDDYVLCPGEGFFVQCPEDKETVTFSKEGRQTTRELRESRAESRSASPTRTIFNIYIKNGSHEDRTRVVINEQASAQYELDKDASKFFFDDSTVPQIYTSADGVMYAINERPLGDGIVNLMVTPPAGGDGEGLCAISLANDVEGYEVTLEDSANGTNVVLKDGKGYSFYASAQNFLLHIRSTTTGITQKTIDSSQEPVLYDLQGRRLSNGQWSNGQMKKGIYISKGKKVIK